MRVAMSTHSPDWKPGDPVPHVHDDVPDLLAGAGLPPEAVHALLDFDTAVFHWYRQVMKGEFPAAVLRRIDADVEVGQLHALTAIHRIRAGVGRAPTEPTIGAVAEELALDPSRASRIVADLVARGLVKRQAAQDDGRKSVLAVTARGNALIRRFRLEKWSLLSEVFQDWSPEALQHFAQGFRRYTEALARVIDAPR